MARAWFGAASVLAVLGLVRAAALPVLAQTPAGGNPAPPAGIQTPPNPDAKPAASQPTTGPAERQPILFRVLEVRGDVQHAGLEGNDWKSCAAEDRYPEQTRIRTGVRSAIKFQVGDEQPYTALLVESVGQTILSEAYKTSDTKRVRIGVGYGTIRAGVAEGGLKSDFTVDSPVATLSKRGTWNFGLSYERGTDRFEVFLIDYGLVDALNKLTNERRQLAPGQMVTQAMLRWFDQAQMVRNVPVVDVLGQQDVQVAFNRLEQSGLGVLGPGSGQQPLINLSSSMAQQNFADLARTAVPVNPGTGGTVGPIVRPEGFFGTGRGDELLQVIIKAQNPLAQKGLARPGTYLFRRSALEGWLKGYEGRR
jgi:hypothetical protein